MKKNRDMINWYKKTPLFTTGEHSKEIWIREQDGNTDTYNIDLYLGKKTNLLSLKKDIVETIQKQVKYYQTSRTELYQTNNLEEVQNCPVCGSITDYSNVKVEIYGAKYVQCKNCTHIYVSNRPSTIAINNFYLNNVTYAATYTDKKSAEYRLQTIAISWLEWTIDVYEKQYGIKPKKILDVGSGAGHFVEACRRYGIKSEGIELSESSRKFAKDIWGIKLDGRDFNNIYKEYEGYDIVTFWGLLEHTPNPGILVNNAYNIISKSSNGGLLISKLPRWDSLSTAIQSLVPGSVIRHLDPQGHIMAFTDASAAEIYVRNNIVPTTAWYYGMDIYETLMQFGNKTGSYEHFTKTGDLQIELQQYIDEMRFSDGLTIVGIPEK